MRTTIFAHGLELARADREEGRERRAVQGQDGRLGPQQIDPAPWRARRASGRPPAHRRRSCRSRCPAAVGTSWRRPSASRLPRGHGRKESSPTARTSRATTMEPTDCGRRRGSGAHGADGARRPVDAQLARVGVAVLNQRVGAPEGPRTVLAGSFGVFERGGRRRDRLLENESGVRGGCAASRAESEQHRILVCVAHLAGGDTFPATAAVSRWANP